MTTNQQNHPDFRQEFHKVGHYTKDTLSGFKTFILRGNVVDLAIGIVIGAAFTSVVNSVVGDIITPLIPIPGTNLSAWKVPVPYSPIDPKTGAHIAIINFGGFVNAVISFLIVAAVLYFFVVRPVAALLARYKPKEAVTPPTTRECPYCLQDIPLLATRCAYCTSPVPPVGQQANPATANQAGPTP